MKHSNIILLTVFLLIGNIVFAQIKQIVISGSISGIDMATKAQLFQFNKGKIDTLATVDVVNGAFKINLTRKAEPQFCFLKLSNLKGAVTLFIDDANVRIEGSASSWPKVSITGSSAHSDYELYQIQTDSLRQLGQELSGKLRIAQEAKDSIRITKLNKQLKEAISQFEKQQIEFVKSHLDSYYSAVVIINAKWHWIKKRELFERLLLRIKNSTYGELLKNDIAASKKQSGLLEVGDTIPPFLAKTSKGKSIDIKEVVKHNALTLIDFWASWCIPCRKENQNLIKAYKENKKKGFDIIGISLDEKDADWKQAIIKDGLQWEQVSDLKGWASPIAMKYLAGLPLKFIPQNFLVDANGKILARNLRGEKLSKKVEELLN